MNKFFLIGLAAILFFAGCEKLHSPVWTLKLKSRPYADVLIQGGRFYAFSQAGEVVCGDSKTGKIFWNQTVDGPVLGTPALSKSQVLYVLTQNGRLYCLNAEDGKTKWRVQIRDSFIAPVTLFGDAVLLASEQGHLYAVSSLDGSEKWRFSGASKFNAGAAIYSSNLLIGGWAKEFYSLKFDGTLNWKFKTADRITTEALVVGNTAVFAGYDQYVYAVEIPSGRMLWRFSADHPSNLVVRDEELLFVSGKDLVSVSSRSGKEIRRRSQEKIIERVYAYPPNVLLLAGRVYAVSPAFDKTSLFLKAARPIFKLSFGEGVILASDDLYSIYGYGL